RARPRRRSNGLGGRGPAPPADLIDLGEERAKRGGAYRIPCPKCGKRVLMHAERCPHCGVWFNDQAVEVAKRADLFSERHSDARNRRVVLVLLGSLAVVVLTLFLLLLR